jgi:hypothetical protein
VRGLAIVSVSHSRVKAASARHLIGSTNRIQFSECRKFDICPRRTHNSRSRISCTRDLTGLKHSCRAAPSVVTEARYIRSGHQQLIEFRELIRLAFRVRDDDQPTFARPDPGLGDDDKITGPFDLHSFVVAFCDHLVSQLGIPTRIDDASPVSWL